MRTTTRLLALTLAVVMAWAMPSAAAASTTTTSRAAWSWFRDDPRDLVDLARRHGLGDLYVHVSPTVLTDGDLARLTELARLAQPAGLRLVALGGDPRWTNRPQDALAWQRAALATGLFDATHVDVEPYALAGWAKPKQRAALVQRYVDLLDALQDDDPRPLEADVPFWYGTVDGPDGGTLADAVLARVDAVTVMTYRDSAAGILAVGSDVLDRADALAAAGRLVPVHLAAETNPLADCPSCTFAEEGAAALEAALDAVDAGAAAHPSYAGIAVHDVRGWSALA